MLFAPRILTRKSGSSPSGPMRAEPGCDQPSRCTGVVMIGSGEFTTITPPGAGEKSNVMRVQSALAFAALIASRSVHCGPHVPSSESAVELTCTVPPLQVCAESVRAPAPNVSISVIPVTTSALRPMSPPWIGLFEL